MLHQRNLRIDGLTLHVVEGGDARRPAVLFLHGWPQCAAAFEAVMTALGRDLHVVAIDLPGVGRSTTPAPANTKRALAKVVRTLVAKLQLRQLTLVGHDVGGQIAYAFLREYPAVAERVVLMNIAIPGVDPWDDVLRNPQIWHFGFHAVPELPERLVTGKQAAYFRFFFDRISAHPGAIPGAAQQTYARAYARASALRTGFDWYRAFTRDAKDNQRSALEPVSTPVLYLRGGEEPGIDIARYVRGLKQAGVRNLCARIIPGSGHFTADEQPARLARALRDFIGAVS